MKGTSMPHLDRITRNPEVMGGKPCLRGMRVTCRNDCRPRRRRPLQRRDSRRLPISRGRGHSPSSGLCCLAGGRDGGPPAGPMKLLVDMNRSPMWVPFLVGHGFEAVHWSAIGAPSAADSEILDYAGANGLV